MIKNPCPDSLCVCVLASGSRGNAIYVASENTAVLFDAGLSGSAIEARMKQRGLPPDNLDALVVSHEHSDHILGVGVLARRYSLPVYINRATRNAAASRIGKIRHFCRFECGAPFR
ncbi:MAG: MBL fold metallo-hydrolase, partial [Desulfosalsimonas sp.]